MATNTRGNTLGANVTDTPSFNESTGAENVYDVSPAALITLKLTDDESLTAPSTQTTAVDVSSYSHYTFEVTVSSINTDVTFEIQGSVNGSNFGTLSLSSDAVPNGATTTNQMTATANKTYMISSDQPADQIRLNFVSETGGTTAVLTVNLFARRK